MPTLCATTEGVFQALSCLIHQLYQCIHPSLESMVDILYSKRQQNMPWLQFT
jgi:hypothetical protein